jgi:hypothetical protein
MEPKIIVPDLSGVHNRDLEASNKRLQKAKSYQDLSTVIISPIVGDLHPVVVQSWMSLMRPMNQQVIGPIFMQGFEVGDAYNNAIKMILEHPALSKFKYVCTIEHDNLPPPDALLKLYEAIGEYDVVGGLYWTKGEGGMPMIYGNPAVLPKNYIPQMPIPEAVQPANGLGMGMNLFKMDCFTRMPKEYYGKWFRTLQEYSPSEGARMATQDLYFYGEGSKYVFKYASVNSCKVGHYDKATGITW